TLPNDAEITNNIVSVIPTKGAVVLAKFNARIGGRLFLHLKRSDNKPVPFGSIVTIEGQSSSSGIVGDNSGV
ncbi:FimD/PapC C-terminal domain-containing protein, partial [Yersinia pestis]